MAPVQPDAVRPTAAVGPVNPSPYLVSEPGSDARAVGGVGGYADHYPQAGSAGAAVGGEQFERPWGLDPSAPLSPATIGGTAIGFLLGAAAFAVAQPRGLRREWLRPSTPAKPDTTSDLAEPEDDDDLVPDEAIVEGMLLRQDGRMKQSAIVDMTDWSKAKVSRLLSTMADEGRVVKVSIGRENLICLNGWEPDAVKDPHQA